jgi:hypothetical protein
MSLFSIGTHCSTTEHANCHCPSWRFSFTINVILDAQQVKDLCAKSQQLTPGCSKLGAMSAWRGLPQKLLQAGQCFAIVRLPANLVNKIKQLGAS